LIPFQVEIVTAITAVLVGAILTVYILVLKKNGWIGKPSIETGLKDNSFQSQPELKKQKPAPIVVEKEAAIVKQKTKETETALETDVPIVKSQENKNVLRKNNKKVGNLAKEKLAGCNHYFGYLWTLPKGTTTPDECYCCTKLIECYKETKD
jgi:hypothetical protein